MLARVSLSTFHANEHTFELCEDYKKTCNKLQLRLFLFITQRLLVLSSLCAIDLPSQGTELAQRDRRILAALIPTAAA